MTSKLRLSHPSGCILDRQDRKKLDKYGRMWRFNCIEHELLPQGQRINKEHKFNAICVKQSEKNAWICGETIHGFCTTIMLTLHCLFVNFWPKPTLRWYPSLCVHQTWPRVTFFVPKNKENLKRLSIFKHRCDWKRIVEAIPKIEFQKCFKDWKKRWHQCIVSRADYFEENNIDVEE